MASELVSRYGVNKNHNFIKLQIQNIWYRNLLDHYQCQFNHESEEISIPYSNLYFLGTTIRGDPGTRPDFRISYGGTLHTVKSVVRAIPTSDGNVRMPSHISQNHPSKKYLTISVR
jgi:hypothetical protein